MERIPEPELMDDAAQALAYASADFEEPHSAFIARLAERFPGLPVAGRAVDLGCGPADISIRFARALPEWQVDGCDGAPQMLRLAEDAVRRAGVAERVRLIRMRLPSEGLARGRYDAVISNSLLHHLSDPQALWGSVRTCARPGAAVFIMDLMRPASRADAEALVHRYAEGEPPVLRRDFFNSLLAAYRIDEVGAQLREAGLDHLQVQAVSDRHLIVHGEAP